MLGEMAPINISGRLVCRQAQYVGGAALPCRRRQTVCKPGSVPRDTRGWPFIWDVRRRTPRATDPSGGTEGPPGSAGQSRFCLPLLLGLAPGGVCPATAVTGGAVRSYRTISPLPPAGSRCTSRNGLGGMFSVALSLRSPPPGVTRHRASVEPGLSSLRPTQRAPAKSGHPTVWHGIMWAMLRLSQRPRCQAAARRTSAMKRRAASELSPRR
jgi:hypothetical protein